MQCQCEWSRGKTTVEPCSASVSALQTAPLVTRLTATALSLPLPVHQDLHKCVPSQRVLAQLECLPSVLEVVLPQRPQQPQQQRQHHQLLSPRPLTLGKLNVGRLNTKAR